MMKNTFSKIRTLAALLMAGAAFASCSSNDEGIIEPTPAQNGKQVYTLTVKASKGNAGTRALDLDGDNIVASWKVGDELTVYNVKKGTTLGETLTATSVAGSTATFTGSLTGTIEGGDNLILTYHPTEFTDFRNQDGTLKGTNGAENYDQASAEVVVASVDGGEITTTGDASFATETAVVKFTLTDGTNPINAKTLKMTAKVTVSEQELELDMFEFTIPSGTYTTNGDGILYFSMPTVDILIPALTDIAKGIVSSLPVAISENEIKAAITAKIATATITFTATDANNDTYAVNKTGYKFESGKYYKNVTLTMAKPADPMLSTPLTLEATSDGTIVVKDPKNGMQYSLNGGEKTAVTSDAINVKTGDKVAFYGDGTNITHYFDGPAMAGTTITEGTAYVKVYGNIMSLVDEDNFASATTLTANYTFANLFNSYYGLTDASGLVLPATTLTDYCYWGMFSNCCYLIAAPELPATTLADYCYWGMFYDCTSLTTSPVLPAPTLAEGCYQNMFCGCENLNAITCLATDISASCCTQSWVDCVAETGTFTKAASTTGWSEDMNGIPSGWTVVDAAE